jgi:hypothetical protein
MLMFTMRVIVDEREFVAEGSSKKTAKSNCAAKAVQELDVDEYFNERVKKYRYRICEVGVSGEPAETTDPIETLWKDEAEEIVLTIRRSNNLDEHDLKTIKLRVLKP